MFHEKGRIWNAAAVWSQLSSSQEQNDWHEKRLKINAFTCYHQWLLLGDGSIVICGTLHYHKWGVMAGMQGPLYVLRWPFRLAWTGMVCPCDGMAKLEEGEPSFCQQIFGKWEGYQSALITLCSIGSDYLGPWSEKDPAIVEQKAWLISDVCQGQERKR